MKNTIDLVGLLDSMSYDDGVWFLNSYIPKQFDKFQVKLIEKSDLDDYNVYAIYHFIDHDVYIKFVGWYASLDGTNFTKYQFVEPKQILKTIYE